MGGTDSSLSRFRRISVHATPNYPSDMDALYLVERDLLGKLVVELCRPRRGVTRDPRRNLQIAPVAQVLRDPRPPEASTDVSRTLEASGRLFVRPQIATHGYHGSIARTRPKVRYLARQTGMGDGVKMRHWNLHAYCPERVRPHGPPGPETVTYQAGWPV